MVLFWYDGANAKQIVLLNLSAILGSFINPINFNHGTFINDHLKMCPETVRHDDVLSVHVTFLLNFLILALLF